MLETVFSVVAIVVVAAITLIGVTGLLGGINVAARSREGLLHFYFYAMLGKLAVETAFSGRTLNMNMAVAGEGVTSVHPIVTWGTRGISLLLLIIAIERIIHYGRRHASGNASSLSLMVAFVIFWICTVLSPSLWSAHPKISHEYTYPLILGVGALLATHAESIKVIDSLRTGALLLMLAGFAVVPINPSMAMDMSYTQGLIPGLPRLAGLTPHPVFLGMFSQLGLLCLWVRPYPTPWLNRFVWGLGLIVLFMAQSKTAWISFVLCAICMLIVRKGPSIWRNFGNPERRDFSIAVILVVTTSILALALTALIGDIGWKIDRFLNSSEGAQLASLTGRDRIWAIAFDEWHRNPIFGYGPSLFDGNFQLQIGMPFATHGHNQFVDTLARSGLVGATGLIVYAIVLLALSLRYCKSSGGLTLALFIALAFRSISEVPLVMMGYGVEFIGHVLLLIVLAGECRKTPEISSTPVNNKLGGMLPA